MPDLPEEAVQAVREAVRKRYGAAYIDIAEFAALAAAPVIAAEARAEALRDAINGRVTLDEQAAAQGHTGPQRIEDLSSSLPFSEADVAAFFSAMEDRGPSYEEDLRAEERHKVSREIAKEILRQKPSGGTQMTWDSGLRRAARVARQIGDAHVEEA